MDYEQRVAEALSLKQVPGSGNRWHRLGDNDGRGMLVSCKSTVKRSWAETRRQLREVIDMAAGTGCEPILAVEDVDTDGEAIVVMRVTDLAALLGVSQAAVTERRGARQRRLADVPVLRRQAAR